jgi:hypothetical protein
MPRRQHRELHASGIEEAVGADKKSFGALACERSESGIDLAATARPGRSESGFPRRIGGASLSIDSPEG